MKTESNISIVQGDSRIVAIPVGDGDTSDDYVDPLEASGVKYVVTRERDTATTLHTDDSPSITEAQNVISATDEKPIVLEDLPDDQNVVKVVLEPDDTKSFPLGELHHECELTGIRGGVLTVMQGSVFVRPGTA